MNTKILLAIGGVVLLGGATFAMAQRGWGRGDVQGGRRARIQRAVRGQHRMGEVARRLGVTDDQRALARSTAQQLRPLAESVKPQIREIVQRARALARSGDREGARAVVQTELKPLVERLRAQTRPMVQPLIQSLTPEQRAKVENFLRARGRTLDEGKLADRLALGLARARGPR